MRWGVEYVLSAADQRTRSCISMSHDFWHILDERKSREEGRCSEGPVHDLVANGMGLLLTGLG